MRHLFGFSILLISLVSCGEMATDGYLIKGTISGDIADSTKVYLRKSDADLQPVESDSTFIAEGSFTFTGKINEPRLYYIFIEEVSGGIPLILEDGNVDVTAHKDSLNAAIVSGTPQNEFYAEFLEASRNLAQKRNSINREMRAAMSAQDTANMNALRDEFFELQEEGLNFEKEFIGSHPDALISALVVNRMIQMKSVPEEVIQSLYNSLSKEIQSTTIGVSIAEKLEASMRTAIGSKAPNFSAPTPEGQDLSLNQVLGKVTLVDFWAAWCRPCRAENPNIVRVYGKFKDKGLSILGVSLDRNAEAWKKAIEDDGLSWHQVSNVRYFDEIAELYSVTAIPASFILDENGVIVAKNLRGAALEEKIAELLP
ncbi:MAG: TlpA disulfide reductase family protein [Robiginitalea sp.]|jgi:peroxiredoxin